MTREEMLSLMIQRFGFENEYTIQFAEAIEWLGLAESEALLMELLAMPIEVFDDDEA